MILFGTFLLGSGGKESVCLAQNELAYSAQYYNNNHPCMSLMENKEYFLKIL